MRWWHGFPFVRQEKPKEVEISTGNKSTGAVTVGDGNHFWGTRRVLWSWEDRLPTQTPVTVGVTSNGKSERRQQQPEQQQKEQDMKTGRMREKHRKEKGRKTRGYLNKIETLEEAASNAEDYEKKRGRWWCSSRREESLSWGPKRPEKDRLQTQHVLNSWREGPRMTWSLCLRDSLRGRSRLSKWSFLCVCRWCCVFSSIILFQDPDGSLINDLFFLSTKESLKSVSSLLCEKKRCSCHCLLGICCCQLVFCFPLLDVPFIVISHQKTLSLFLQDLCVLMLSHFWCDISLTSWLSVYFLFVCLSDSAQVTLSISCLIMCVCVCLSLVKHDHYSRVVTHSRFRECRCFHLLKKEQIEGNDMSNERALLCLTFSANKEVAERVCVTGTLVLWIAFASTAYVWQWSYWEWWPLRPQRWVSRSFSEHSAS